jgi:hypothetical protein
VRRWRWIIAGIAGLAAVTAIVALWSRGVPVGKRIAGLAKPEKLILYSIDGTDDSEANRRARQAEGEDDFAGYPVLGKIELKSQKERNRLIAALQNAVAYPDGTPNRCFWPRHAILAVENGKTFEIVICFQCRQYMLNGRGFPLIAKRPESMFNDYLRQHGIAIAP